MSRISDRTLNEIRAGVSLRELAEVYVNLKRAGSQWRGLSPFTNEKTPSFYINDEKGVFYCYSSGQGGNIFKFLQLKENLTFVEAVEVIARRFNITIEYENDDQPPQQASLRRELFDIHQVAAEYYRNCLLADHQDAIQVRQYWEQERKFKPQTAAEFQVGLAPRHGGDLLQILLKKKFSAESLRSCGLFYSRNDQTPPQQLRPRFRGRLMIPIRDIQARVIAFTARVLPITPTDDPTHEAKYINSPETLIFHKSELLFNLDKVRRELTSDSNVPLLVEGQLDAIRCHEVGVLTAVAPQGTAITEQQLRLLRRYSPRINVLLDGDRAGVKAALRLLPIALENGLDVLFLPLNEGTDPDLWFQTKGSEGLDLLLQQAVKPMGFAIRSLLPDPVAATPRERVEVLKVLFSWIRKIEFETVKQDYLAEIARQLGADRTSIEADFALMEKNDSTNAPYTVERPAETAPHELQLTKCESMLLLLALHHREIAVSLAEIIESEWINKNSIDGQILDRLLAEIKHGDWSAEMDPRDILETEEEHNLVSALLVTETEEGFQPLEAANQSLAALYTAFLKRKRETIDQVLTNTQSTDRVKIETLMREKIALRAMRNNIPQIGDVPISCD